MTGDIAEMNRVLGELEGRDEEDEDGQNLKMLNKKQQLKLEVLTSTLIIFH